MKLIYFVCMIAVTVPCNGQFHFGAIGGISNSRISIKNYTFSTFNSSSSGTTSTYIVNKNVSRNAFFAGAKGIFDLNSSISVSSELLLGNMSFNQHVQMRTSVYNTPTDSTFGNDIYKLLYLSLPVYIQFYAPVGNARVYVGVGGYLSYGLVGSDEFDLSSSSLSDITDSISQITFSNDAKYKSVVFHTNRLDYGVSVMAGLQLRNNFFIEGAFDDGLHTIFKDKFLVDDPNKIYYNFPNKKRTFRLGIGYLFN